LPEICPVSLGLIRLVCSGILEPEPNDVSCIQQAMLTCRQNVAAMCDVFCQVMQIFYPYSMQLYPNVFPGEDPRDCPRNVNRDQ